MVRVFISWSGEPSKTMAQTLADWLPAVHTQIQPWLSETSIAPGEQWLSSLLAGLDGVDAGIVCLTPVNQHSPWLGFEVGALVSRLDPGLVFPYRLGISPSQVTGPLAQFQGGAADLSGTLALLSRLLERTTPDVDQGGIAARVRELWPDLERSLQDLPEQSRSSPDEGGEWPALKSTETLQDALRRLSETQRRIVSLLATTRHEMYPDDLSRLTGLSRGEVMYRCRDLRSREMIVIHRLTDYAYALDHVVVRLAAKAGLSPNDL